LNKSIIYIPGKGAKPVPQAHQAVLWKTLNANISNLDPQLGAQLSEQNPFNMVAWNFDFYQRYEDIEQDIPWIEKLIAGEIDAHQAQLAADKLASPIKRFLYLIVDRFPKLIEWFADERIKSMLDGSTRYFKNTDGIADHIRDLAKAKIEQEVQKGNQILLIGHSMGSIIAYEACLELSQKYQDKIIDTFISMGSPLGLIYTQARLLKLANPNKGSSNNSRPPSHPTIIKHWKNISAVGDMVSTDRSLNDDFRAMLDYHLIDTIDDYYDEVYNLFKNDQGFNPHRSYGYLANPVLAKQIVQWWNES
jgi:predicted esterase